MRFFSCRRCEFAKCKMDSLLNLIPGKWKRSIGFIEMLIFLSLSPFFVCKKRSQKKKKTLKFYDKSRGRQALASPIHFVIVDSELIDLVDGVDLMH